MSTAAYHPIGGLKALENGLNSLRRSGLMVVPEFKNMFAAIERHHNDIKLAHLTGKAKDLQDQAIRDTKFYNILIQMLCEVKEKRTGEQRGGLKRVYTWYMANKHVLNCGPRFGKQQLKDEAKELLKKATTPRAFKRAKSAKERPLSNKVTASRSGGRSSAVPQQTSSRKMYNSLQSTPRISRDMQDPPNFKLDYDLEEEFEPFNHVAANSPELDESDPSQFFINEEEIMNNNEETIEGKRKISSESGIEEHCPSPPRVLLRPKTSASVTFSPLKEQSSNRPESVTPLMMKQVHPIPSLVNPHAALAKELSPVDATDPSQRAYKPVTRAGLRSAPPSRPDNLQAWQTFSKNRSYGQDIVGKLSFVGRSGTASDVRYSAHNNGEAPEMHTKDLIQEYSKHISPPGHSPRALEDEENIFVQQTLEEFYETADGIKPTARHSPRISHVRARSAPPKGRNSKTPNHTQFMATPKLGHQLEESQTKEPEPEEKPVPKEADTGVRLNTVINVIDSVTDDMAYFKEKLVPDPQSGFRQPSTASLPTPRDAAEVDTDRTSVCPTPLLEDMNEEEVCRPFSSPLASHTAIVREKSPEGVKGVKIRCKSASLIDWRGKIQPETLRYKWSKTKFGGHTYLKKWYRPSLRSAGSTSGGKRPKTAPITPREKWKTGKDSDKNKRAVQAASHSTMVVDQNDVDHMMTVQHLLSGEDRTDSMGSLFDFDEGFWKNFHKSNPSLHTEQPTLEFLSFITPSASGLADQKSQISTHRSEAATGNKDDENDGTEAKDKEDGPKEQIGIHIVPHSEYNEDALNAALQEDLENLSPRDPDLRILQKQSPTGTGLPINDFGAGPIEALEKEDTDSHIEVHSVPPGGQGPTPLHKRTNPLQSLSQSEQWQFSTEDGFHEVKKEEKKGDHFCDVQLGPEHFCFDCRPHMMTTKVERSAGRMPSRSHSASAQMLAYSRRYSDALRRAPPLRTPPSIPTPTPSAKKPPRKSGQIIFELEHHARKTRSPRNFMQKVEGLRSINSSRCSSLATTLTNDPIIGMSLQVCKLPVSSRGRSSLSSDFDFDFNPAFHKNMAEQPHMSREESSLQAINENTDQFSEDKQVSFTDLRHVGSHIPTKPMTAPATGTGQSEDLSLHRHATFTSIGSRQSGGKGEPLPPPSSRSIARIGRPIAQVSQIPDPDELYQAVVLQKEAAAAVDIQRIFRGYVARNVYKSLISEERWRKEEERKAAIQIQRIYRGHLTRKNEIYNRPPLNPDLVQWSKDVKDIQTNHAAKRHVKMENLSKEISNNHKVANSKIATIGPHVEIYDIYHPKITGPTKQELNNAAVKIQKVVRGWVVRRKMEKLARKATWYGSSFPKMVKEYKTMLKHVQLQHGVDKAKTPFSIKDMNDYIDIRRRYESVFEKKSFGGELEQGDIEAFFKECDLYPSQAEIEEAIDVTMHGQANKRGNHGLKKKEIMDMIFYIYCPPATGLEGTRQSTWMNPIIDGQEARKLLGSEFVEPAPLAPCAKLVIDAKREQRQREQAQREADERMRIEESKQKKEEERKEAKKSRKVTLQEPGSEN